MVPLIAVARVLGAAWQTSKLCCSQSADAFVGGENRWGRWGRGPNKFPSLFCKDRRMITLGTFRFCIGKLVPPWGQATCKANAAGETVLQAT